MDPIAEACGIQFIISLPSCVLRNMNFERCFPSTMGMEPFLERFILKGFSINLSKKGFIPMLDGKHLSKIMCPKTQEGREIMIGFHMPQQLD